MADLTPGELAKIDQIHAGITNKLAELVSSAVDGIRTEGEALTASKLASTAQATDHNSVSTLFSASLVLNARYQMADEKRHAAKRQQEAADAEVAGVYAFCGHAYISNVGEFTCRRGASHSGQHWDSLAEFSWDD